MVKFALLWEKESQLRNDFVIARHFSSAERSSLVFRLQDPSTVPGMFKWRADGTEKIQRKERNDKEEKSCESR